MKAMMTPTMRKRPAVRVSGAKALKDHAARRGCASNGKLLGNAAKKKTGRSTRKGEAPGAPYSGKNKGKGATVRLSRQKKQLRIGYRVLAGLSASDRVRLGATLGYLKTQEGKKCPEGCGRKLQLMDGDSRRIEDSKIYKLGHWVKI